MRVDLLVDAVADAIAAGIEAWKRIDEQAMSAAIDDCVTKIRDMAGDPASDAIDALQRAFGA